MKLSANVGKIDRVARALIALILVASYALGVVSGTLATVALVGGIALLASAAFGFCGLYTLLGVNSCGLKK